MANLAYPDDFDHVNKVHELLGTLWSKHHPGRAVCRSVVAANLELMKQHHQDLAEVVLCRSRLTVPLHHVERWIPIRLRQQVEGQCDFAKPDKLVRLSLITNRITAASRVLFSGIDFKLCEDRLVFAQPPFDDVLFSSVGNTLLLWGFKAEFDWEYLQSQYGYLWDMNVQSKQQDKDLLNAVADVTCHGMTKAGLHRILASMLRIPVSQGPVETVEVVDEDSRGYFVATDAQVYRLSCRPSVQPGQQIKAGTPLADRFKVYYLCAGIELPLRELTIPAELLIPAIRGALTFKNEEQQVINGCFPVTGRKDAVRRFHEFARPFVLEHNIQQVNPMRFIVDNLLCNNTVLIVAPEAELDKDLLRRVMPPQTVLLFADENAHIS